MCKKLLVLTSLILLLGSVSIAEDIQWTAGGRNTFWGTAANWDLNRPPTLDDEVRIDVPAAAAPNGPIIQDGIDAKAKGIFTEEPGEPTLTMTGGTLEVAEWIWWGDGMDSYAVWTMSGGTVTVTNEFELGWGGGAGTLTMTGGTISAGEAVIPTGSGAFGELFLYGGTYNVTKPGGLEVNANGLIDITDGTLVLEGDDTAKINDLFAAGLITSMGGEGILEVDYDIRNAGKTTVTAALAPTEPRKPSAAGLVASYGMENDVLDGSGNEFHGTIAGDPVFAEGAIGMALDFDGDGDYVDCGNDPNFSMTDAFALSVWINWRTPTVDWQTVIAKGDNAWRLARGGNTQTMDFGFTAGGDRGWQAARTASDVPLGEWHHVSATYDTTEGAKIYLDGVLEGTNPDTAGITVGDYPVYIGDNSQQTGRFWDGLIDEVAIYSRVLSAGEVMYLAGHRVTPVDPGNAGLLALWTCDEGAGAAVADVSGNGRDGTFVNGDPAWVAGVEGSAVELIGPTLIETPPLDMELTEATMAGWILPYGPQPDWSSIIMTRTPGLATGFNILGYQLAYHWNDTSSSWSFRGGDMIAEDEWTFAAVTVQPDKATFYINGEAGSVNEITHEPCLWNSNIYLGGDGNDNWISRRMIGALDNVAIYGRALSGGEILYLAGERAPVVLFAEDFEGLPLGPNVDEALAGEAVWTDTPPEGWTIDESGIPGIGDPATDGVTEWAGWAFANKDWWIQAAEDQDRSMFTLGVGTVAIADPDEWDDQDHAGKGRIQEDPYDTWLSTPAIDISGIAAGTVQLKFDSSWRPEFDSNYHQTASITASFDGGDPVEVLLWESDESSPNYKPYATNETVIVELGNPEGATSVVLTFGLFDAGNDWWWAIDNVQVIALPPAPTEADPSLAIYYSFDEVSDVVVDQSGKGHDGVVVGEVSAEAEGIVAGAAKFANAGYLDLDGPNVAAEDIPTSAITLAAWIKCENNGGHHAIFNARASDQTWLVHPEARSNGEFRWLLRSYGGTTMFDIRAGAVTWDEWLHFAGTYDKASARAALCINGELVAEMDVANPDDIAGDWGLGARVGKNIDDARPFTGLMDEFRMYTRALSQEEIAGL